MGVAIFFVLAFVAWGVERLVTYMRSNRAPPVTIPRAVMHRHR
jgi:hypothetical protein